MDQIGSKQLHKTAAHIAELNYSRYVKSLKTSFSSISLLTTQKTESEKTFLKCLII
jgi:hypothetical protein